MRVLHVASECAPLVKTGGLADVLGALPGVLAAEDVSAKVLLPGYPQVMAALEASREIPLPEGLEG
ncbi:MAG: glycogen/starch synthase, partial [Pseudomonadota bacterium]